MKSRKEKIFLTGADGFLGRYVADTLRNKGLSFTASSLGDLDIMDKKAVINKTKGYKSVIHLADNIRTSDTDNAEKHFNINALGTLNILEACRINKIPRIILASSVEVYGNLHKAGTIKETDITVPENFYGQSKLLAEGFCREYSEKFGIKFTALRFTYLYGHGMHPSRIVPKMINAAIDGERLILSVDPSSFMDMVYVRDAAQAVLLSLKSKKAQGEVINVSSGIKTRIRDVDRVISSIYPSFKLKIKTQKEIGNHYLYDNHRAKNILKFKPAYSLEAGFLDYIKCRTDDK